MGGNLCKFAHHIAIKLIKYIPSRSILLLINATFIRLIHKYSKNVPFFVQFLYVFVLKLAKNCTKLAIFISKLYKN